MIFHFSKCKYNSTDIDVVPYYIENIYCFLSNLLTRTYKSNNLSSLQYKLITGTVDLFENDGRSLCRASIFQPIIACNKNPFKFIKVT